MHEALLDSHGISYRVSDIRPTRLTLVLIHGLTGSSSAWYEHEKYLERDFNIVNVDLLGHGKSAKPREYGEYSIEAHARAIYALINRLDIGSFVTVSHSLGTLVALELLHTHGEKARASVFISPTFHIGAKVARVTRAMIDGAAALAETLLCPSSRRGRTDYTKHPNSGDWNIFRMHSDIRNTSVRCQILCLSQLYRYDQAGKWENLKVPVLIIHGARDTLVPIENARRFHDRVPGSRLIVFEDADHIVILNNAREICDGVKQFLSGLECSAA
jgi:pimeloyl-ACP methyl ester carboxylesterase